MQSLWYLIQMIYIVLFCITLRLFFLLGTFRFASFSILALGLFVYFCKIILVILYDHDLFAFVVDATRFETWNVLSSLETSRSSESVVRIFINRSCRIFKSLKSHLFTQFFSLFHFVFFSFFCFWHLRVQLENFPCGQYRQLLRWWPIDFVGV